MKNIAKVAMNLVAGGLGVGACYYDIEETNNKHRSVYFANNLDDSWNKCCINNPGSVLATFEQYPGAQIERKYCNKNTIAFDLF